jgi:hypothetical protein
VWLFVAAGGLMMPASLRLPFIDFEISSTAQLICTLTACMLFAHLPVRSAAAAAHQWREQHRRLAGRKPVSLWLVAGGLALLTAVVVLGIPLNAQFRAAWAVGGGTFRSLAQRGCWTLIVLLLAYLTAAALFRTAGALRLKGTDWMVALFVVLLWGLPPAVEGIYISYQQEVRSVFLGGPGWVTAISPAAALTFIWRNQLDPLFRGAGVQTLVFVILALVSRWAVRRRTAARTRE